jgi:hypothetical protein
MADYCETAVVQQTIPDVDMAPLERLLLSHIFQFERDGEGWYFFAEEGPASIIMVDRARLAAALAETRDVDSSVHAYVAEQFASTAADDADIDLDLSGTSWEFMLQDVVKRSATLAHVSIVSAFSCSRMRRDGFGGMAVLITADAIQGKSTEDILNDFLDEAEHDALGVAPGFGAHVLVRLTEASVRAALPEIVGADPDLTITADDVTDADIRAACLAVLDHTDVSDLQGLAVFNAALHAIREAGQRRGPKV